MKKPLTLLLPVFLVLLPAMVKPQPVIMPRDTSREERIRMLEAFCTPEISREDVEKMFAEEDGSYDESYGFRLHVNQDSVLDYFIVMGLGDYPFGSDAFFADGVTGEGIPLGSDVRLSYPREFPQAEVVDINCEDGQQEVIMKSAYRHMGTSYDVAIYRYNTNTRMIEKIFSENVLWEEEKMISDSSYTYSYKANYIDILYQHGACINEIRVQEANTPNVPDSDPAPHYNPYKKGILSPKQNGRVTTCVFNPAKQTFEVKK